MKYYLIIPGLFFVINVFGQNPVEKDSLGLSLYGSKFYVPYLKINKFDTTIFNVLDTPVYLFNKSNFTFGKNAIERTNNVIETLLTLDTLNKINDSISDRKEKELNYIIQQTNDRVENFKGGYLECQNINKELSRMLDDSIRLNKDQSKRTKWNRFQYLLWGILGGGLVGTYIGFQAVH